MALRLSAPALGEPMPRMPKFQDQLASSPAPSELSLPSLSSGSSSSSSSSSSVMSSPAYATVDLQPISGRMVEELPDAKHADVDTGDVLGLGAPAAAVVPVQA